MNIKKWLKRIPVPNFPKKKKAAGETSTTNAPGRSSKVDGNDK